MRSISKYLKSSLSIQCRRPLTLPNGPTRLGLPKKVVKARADLDVGVVDVDLVRAAQVLDVVLGSLTDIAIRTLIGETTPVQGKKNHGKSKEIGTIGTTTCFVLISVLISVVQPSP